MGPAPYGSPGIDMGGSACCDAVLVVIQSDFVILTCTAPCAWYLLHVVDTLVPSQTPFPGKMFLSLLWGWAAQSSELYLFLAKEVTFFRNAWEVHLLPPLSSTEGQPTVWLSDTGVKKPGLPYSRSDNSVVLFMLQNSLRKGRLQLNPHLGVSYPMLPSLPYRFYL